MSLTSSPDETVHYNGTDSLFQLLHVSLIIPGLYVKNNTRLGNEGGFLALLLGIRLHSLGLNSLLLGILEIYQTFYISYIKT